MVLCMSVKVPFCEENLLEKSLPNANVSFAMEKTMNEFHVYKYLMNVKIALLHMNLE